MYQVIKEMIEHRGYNPVSERLSQVDKGILIALKKTPECAQKSVIYVKIFESKLELNVVREFLANNFTISQDVITLKNHHNSHVDLIVDELILVCKSYQNSHTNEFRNVSKHIQIIRSDFFNVNVTKLAPTHQKADLNFAALGFQKHNIPTILSSDPQCVFNNFQKGDLIRVVRRCGEISYRIVK